MNYSDRHPWTREAYERHGRDMAARERDSSWEMAPFRPRDPGRFTSAVPYWRALTAGLAVTVVSGAVAWAHFRRMHFRRAAVALVVTAGAGAGTYLLWTWFDVGKGG